MEKYKFPLYISVFSSAGAVIKKFTIEASTKDEAERKAKEWIVANPTSGAVIKLVEIA